MRWVYDIERSAGKSWLKIAQNRQKWGNVWKANVQEWSEMG